MVNVPPAPLLDLRIFRIEHDRRIFIFGSRSQSGQMEDMTGFRPYDLSAFALINFPPLSAGSPEFDRRRTGFRTGKTNGDFPASGLVSQGP